MKKVDWNAFWRAGAEMFGSELNAAIALGLIAGTLLAAAVIITEELKISARRHKRIN